MRKTYPAMIERVVLKGKELDFVERCRWGLKLEDVEWVRTGLGMLTKQL